MDETTGDLQRIAITLPVIGITKVAHQSCVDMADQCARDAERPAECYAMRAYDQSTSVTTRMYRNILSLCLSHLSVDT